MIDTEFLVIWLQHMVGSSPAPLPLFANCRLSSAEAFAARHRRGHWPLHRDLSAPPPPPPLFPRRHSRRSCRLLPVICGQRLPPSGQRCFHFLHRQDRCLFSPPPSPRPLPPPLPPSLLASVSVAAAPPLLLPTPSPPQFPSRQLPPAKSASLQVVRRQRRTVVAADTTHGQVGCVIFRKVFQLVW